MTSRLCLLALVLGLVVNTSVLLAQSAKSDPAPQWDGTLRRIAAPILMYHYVSELPPNADAIREGLTVTPTQFREHLEVIFFQGYTPISLYALDDALLTGAPLPAKPVVLTFDDAYSDHFVTVFPLLRERGYTATFFIPTAFVDEQRTGYMTWVQIAEMANAGMSMEPHTKTHRELTGLTYDTVVYEALGSIESISHYTGRPPHMFSYPVGRYDALTLEVLAQMPVWRAVTTRNGARHTTDNRLEMDRVRVPGGANGQVLRALLENP